MKVRINLSQLPHERPDDILCSERMKVRITMYRGIVDKRKEENGIIGYDEFAYFCWLRWNRFALLSHHIQDR